MTDKKAVETNDTVRDFLTRVGGNRIAEKVNCTDRMIRHVASKNEMPATWYEKSVEAANEVQVAPPGLHLFGFKR
jgi:hypothetical protein